MRSIGTLVAAVWVLAGNAAVAAPGEGAPAPVTDHGVQIRAPDDVAARYQQLRAKARLPTRPGFMLAKGAQNTMTAQGTLRAFDDGVAMLSVKVTPQQAAVLKRVGAKAVSDRRQVRHHTLFGGEYYKQLSVAPPAGQPCSGCADDRLTGPNPRLLKNRVGGSVRLVIQRDRDGQAWVVGVRP